MKSIGLIFNPRKTRAARTAEQIAAWFAGKQISVWISQKHTATDGLPDLACPNDLYPGTPDCLIALGGDGTLLAAARAAARYGIPVLGVNIGHLGFLTEIELSDLTPSLAKLVAGDYRIEERLMLEARVERSGESVACFYGLNDAVITKGPLSRIIKLETHVGNECIDTYAADGMIVSTPTGSTAYSLSAGGPIVSPELQVLLLTPICPHTLYSRPLVVSGDQTVRIVLVSGLNEVMLTIDGQDGFKLGKNDQVVIRKAEHSARLIKLGRRGFFEILQNKLREGAASDV